MEILYKQSRRDQGYCASRRNNSPVGNYCEKPFGHTGDCAVMAGRVAAIVWPNPYLGTGHEAELLKAFGIEQ